MVTAPPKPQEINPAEEPMNAITEVVPAQDSYPEGTVSMAITLDPNSRVSLLTRADRKEVDIIGLTTADLKALKSACEAALESLEPVGAMV